MDERIAVVRLFVLGVVAGITVGLVLLWLFLRFR
jgi:hypothetical protein